MAQMEHPHTYNEAIAAHYQAYRPPLHGIILKKCLGNSTKCEHGLDVGCGTGQSSIALSDFCTMVTGVDPATDMLAQAQPHPGINYLPLTNNRLPLADHTFDVVTFAGSLFYAKSQTTLDEVERVLSPGGQVVIYDFEVLFGQLPYPFELPTEAGDYDHAVNFDGLQAGRLKMTKSLHESVTFQLTSQELAHLLLASHNFYAYFSRRYDTALPFEALVAALGSSAEPHALTSAIYASCYQANPK